MFVQLIDEHHEFVRIERDAFRDFKEAVAVELVHEGGVGGEREEAAVEFVAVDLLALEILHGDAERIGFQAQVQVLGDEDHRMLFLLHQHLCHVQNAVVGHVHVGAAGETPLADHDAEAAALAGIQGIVELDALRERALLTERVDLADRLTGVAAEFILIAFELVEFLDHGHGDDDFVVLKRIERLCAVEDDVRIEHVRFFHSRNPFC